MVVLYLNLFFVILNFEVIFNLIGCGVLVNVVVNWWGFIGFVLLILVIVIVFFSILVVKRIFIENVGMFFSLWCFIGYVV